MYYKLALKISSFACLLFFSCHNIHAKDNVNNSDAFFKAIVAPNVQPTSNQHGYYLWVIVLVFTIMAYTIILVV
jgi:hypothetical protein